MIETIDLITRLRALSRHEHDDLSIGDEAADALETAEIKNHQLAIDYDALLFRINVVEAKNRRLQADSGKSENSGEL
jgi:hypothetical protein